MAVENQFDLNECFIYCDQVAKEFAKENAQEAINLSTWSEKFQEILRMIEDTEKTLDMSEAVMEEAEFTTLYTQGFPEWLSYTTIENKNIQTVITPHSFTMSFSSRDGLGEDLLPLNGKTLNGLAYRATFKKPVYTVEIAGPLDQIIEYGFDPFYETILAENIDGLMLRIRNYCRQNGLPFRFPDRYLITQLKILLGRTREDFEMDGRIISAGAVKQLTGQKGPLAETNIREARERLAKDLPKFAKYYDYQIKLYCLENK